LENIFPWIIPPPQVFQIFLSFYQVQPVSVFLRVFLVPVFAQSLQGPNLRSIFFG
jgi:hypothetical protein